jgi:membrane dipeptidase
MRMLCDHPRNLDDEQLDRLAESGGVVQVTLVSFFLKLGRKESEVTLSDFVDHIDYAVQRMGIAHVGIGSDFDGGGGVVGWRDAGESANVTAELLRRGYDRTAIAALWGGNFLRLLRLAEEAQA